MKELDFEMLLTGSINNFIDSYIDESDFPDIPHKFSSKFKRYIGKLTKKRRRSRSFFARTGFRRTAIIIITAMLMMFGMVMTVGAWRRAFFAFITKPFDTHTDVEAIPDSAAPALIEKSYELGFVPEGFVLTESYDMEECCNTRVYLCGTENIEFTQWVKYMYDPSVNTEGYEMEELKVNGCDGFGIDMKRTGRYLISWDSGEYIFQIVGSVDKETALKMAGSVYIK